MTRLIIRGGFVVDPAAGLAGQNDILIEGDTIASVAPEVSSSLSAEVVDASGKLVFPGFIDLQVNPGSGVENTAQSLLLSGITTPLIMPCNSYKGKPIIEEYGGMRGFVNACKNLSTNVVLAIPIEPPDTVGHETYVQLATPLGEIKDRIDQLTKLGVAAIGEVVLPLGGIAHIVSNMAAETLDELLAAAEEFKVPVLVHTGLGLNGIREAIRVANGRKMHLCHVGSTCAGDSIHAVLEAIEQSPNVTADTHLSEVAGTTSKQSRLMLDAFQRREVVKIDPKSLTEVKVTNLEEASPPLYYSKPNLFSNNLICALSDSVQAIESDDLGDGVRAAILFKNLMALADLSIIPEQRSRMLLKLISKVTINPATILGIDRGILKCGAKADIVIVDPQRPSVCEVLVGGRFAVRNGRFTGITAGELIIPKRKTS